MEKDIAEQIFGTKEYTQPIYYSDDKLCFKMLSQTKNNKICPMLIDINILSENVIRILNQNNCNINTNLINIKQNDNKFCQLLKLYLKIEHKHL